MKKVANIFYTLFFIASLIFEGYCLQKFESDYVTIIGGGAVVLIASYLFIDVLISVYERERDRFLEAARQRESLAIKEVREEMLEMQKFQKALYISGKRQTETLKELGEILESIDSRLEQLAEDSSFEETA